MRPLKFNDNYDDLLNNFFDLFFNLCYWIVIAIFDSIGSVVLKRIECDNTLETH